MARKWKRKKPHCRMCGRPAARRCVWGCVCDYCKRQVDKAEKELRKLSGQGLGRSWFIIDA